MNNASKNIILLIVLVILTISLFPKKYYTYKGINPDSNWQAEKCIGINREILTQYPEGPDRVCFGFVLK